MLCRRRIGQPQIQPLLDDVEPAEHTLDHQRRIGPAEYGRFAFGERARRRRRAIDREQEQKRIALAADGLRQHDRPRQRGRAASRCGLGGLPPFGVGREVAPDRDTIGVFRFDVFDNGKIARVRRELPDRKTRAELRLRMRDEGRLVGAGHPAHEAEPGGAGKLRREITGECVAMKHVAIDGAFAGRDDRAARAAQPVFVTLDPVDDAGGRFAGRRGQCGLRIANVGARNGIGRNRTAQHADHQDDHGSGIDTEHITRTIQFSPFRKVAIEKRLSRFRSGIVVMRAARPDVRPSMRETSNSMRIPGCHYIQWEMH
nr:hypothetical protein [Burkholderia cepacia]